MSYCFDDKTLDDVMELFRRTLSYRKAYFRHVSTDIDLGNAIAGYLVERNENPTAAKQALRTTDKLLGALRGLDTLDFKLSPGSRQRQLLLSSFHGLFASSRSPIRQRSASRRHQHTRCSTTIATNSIGGPGAADGTLSGAPPTKKKTI